MYGLSMMEDMLAKQILATHMSEDAELLERLRLAYQITCDAEPIDFQFKYVNFFKYKLNDSVGIHEDVRDGITAPFTSVIIYVNEEYDGGLFKTFDINNSETLSIKPRAGDIVIINSDLKHESTPVTSGEKYIGVLHWLDRTKQIIHD